MSNARRTALGRRLKVEMERSLISMGGDAERAGWKTAGLYVVIYVYEINGY